MYRGKLEIAFFQSLGSLKSFQDKIFFYSLELSAEFKMAAATILDSAESSRE